MRETREVIATKPKRARGKSGSAAAAKDRSKPALTTAGAGASPSHRRAQPSTGSSPLGGDERRRMVAEAAYFRALARGFAGGDPVADWLAAEAEIATALEMPTR